MRFFYFSSKKSVSSSAEKLSAKAEAVVNGDATASLTNPEPAIKITEVNLANAPNTKKDHDYRPVMFAGCMDLEGRKQVGMACFH